MLHTLIEMVIAALKVTVAVPKEGDPKFLQGINEMFLFLFF